jgi:hypothetical protein
LVNCGAPQSTTLFFLKKEQKQKEARHLAAIPGGIRKCWGEVWGKF